ncbi:MAG TPA: DUF3052 domain-containing protein [Patescibacteria group bacterium]|nr:DUF3052 domain-containing protein [Patescibacteria group bacterium]
MTGYSSTPLYKKLGIKENSRVIFINEPSDFKESLGELPYYIVAKNKLDGNFDYIHIFSKSKEDLETLFRQAFVHLKKDGALWVSWPKKTSGVVTDLDENIIRGIGLKNGLVDVKVAAINDIYSGLKFVYRIKDR